MSPYSLVVMTFPCHGKDESSILSMGVGKKKVGFEVYATASVVVSKRLLDVLQPWCMVAHSLSKTRNERVGSIP